jgi:hypothetical protein
MAQRMHGFLFLAAFTLAASASAARAGYVITPVASSSFASPFATSVGSHPVIIDSGAAAGLFRTSFASHDLVSGPVGGPLTTVYSHTGPYFNGLVANYGSEGPAMNDNGVAAFEATTKGGDFGIYTGNGGTPTKIVLISETLSGQPVNGFFSVDINIHNRVVFGAEVLNTPSSATNGIWAGSGGTNTLIAERGNGYTDVGANPTINDAGTIAFTATPTGGKNGLFEDKGGMRSTIYDANNPLFNGFFDPVINNKGTLLFEAGLKTGGIGLFTGNGGAVNTIVTSAAGSPFGGFSGSSYPTYSINDKGQVAFIAFLKGQTTTGIYTGSDPVADKVIAVGDTLNGGTITTLDMGDRALNDSGQIAFRAVTKDAHGIVTDGIYVASLPAAPTPEPSSWLLLGVGSALLAAWRLTSRLRNQP